MRHPFGPKQLTLGKFGFPPDPPMPRPSTYATSLRVLEFGFQFVLSGLVLSVVLNLVLGLAMLRRANAVPYVTDGGEFGCQLTEHDGPQPARLPSPELQEP